MKKLLALVLALVMTMGLATVGANAAYSDFPDTDAVELEAAMKVMNAVGVFAGKDGKLAPKDNLTRAEAAKLIAYLDLGEKIAETLPETEVFPDVPATHWASKYVAYCAEAGIIQGSDGKFLPNDPLSGYAFGAYLLAVLGYDRNIEGMTGADWQIATAKLMSSNGITSKVEKAGAATLNREEAAQYCLNALKATMVEYENKGTNVTMSDGSSVVIGASKATPVVSVGTAWSDAISAAHATDYSGTTNNAVQLGEKLYNGSLKRDTATVVDGHHGESWEYKNEDVTDFVETDTVLLTYTKAFADAAAFRNAVTRTNSKYIGVQLDIGDGTTMNTTEYDIDVYYNGAAQGTPAKGSAGAKIETYDLGATIRGYLAKNGIVTEFIDTNNDGRADVVNIIEKTAAIVTAAPSLKTDATTGKTSVTIPAGISAVDSSKVTGYEDLAKDDVVLYVRYTDSGDYSIEKAEKISGTVTGNSANGALIGGTAYKATGLSGAAKNYTASSITDTATYDFWLDNSGAIVRAVKTSEGESNYVAVAELAVVNPAAGTTGAIGENLKPYIQAKLVFMDGTSEVAKIATLDGFKLALVNTADDSLMKSVEANLANTDYFKYYNTAGDAVAEAKTSFDGSGSITASSQTITHNKFVIIWDGDPTGAGKERGRYLALDNAGLPSTSTALGVLTGANFYPEGAIMTYTKNSDGTYALKSTALTGDSWKTLANTHAITNGDTDFDGTNIGNANTVFIYRTKNSSGSDVFTVYTGIDNAPTTTGTGVAAYPANANTPHAIVAKNDVAKYVYIDATTAGMSLSSSQTDVVFVSAGTRVAVNGSTTYYEYQGVVNGEVKTVKTTDDLAATATGFYSDGNTVDADGIYTFGTVADGTGVKSTDGNVLVLGSQSAPNSTTSYSYKTGAPAYVITTDGTTYVPSVTATTIEALVLDATDLVYVKANGAGEATAAYVYKVDAKPNTITVTVNDTTGSNGKSVTASDSALADGTAAVTNAGAGDQVIIAYGTLARKHDGGGAETPAYISSVTISGKGTTVTTTSATPTTANVGANTTYTLDALDIGGSLTVTIIVTDGYSGANDVYTYTITVAA